MVRPGHVARLRLQPRGSGARVRARRGARPGRGDAALGHRVGARPQLQPRHRRSARQAGLRRDGRARRRWRRTARKSSGTTSTPWPSAIRQTRTPTGRRWPAPTAAPCGNSSHVYPDDLDAATLYAESLMNLRAVEAVDARRQAGRGHRPRSSRVLESVLARGPRPHRRQSLLHPRRGSVAVAGARAAQRASASNARAGGRTPGPYAGAHLRPHRRPRRRRRANPAGAEADRAYLKTALPGGFYVMAYFSHNLHFLADSHMMQGRFADAQQAGDAGASTRHRTLDDADGRIDGGDRPVGPAALRRARTRSSRCPERPPTGRC